MRSVVRAPGPGVCQWSISLFAVRPKFTRRRRPFWENAFFVTAFTTPPVAGAIQGGGALYTSRLSMLLIEAWLNSKARLDTSLEPELERGGVPEAAGIWPSKVNTVASASCPRIETVFASA